MIRVRKHLLWFLLCQTRTVTLVAVPVAALYVLLAPAVLDERAAGPVFFVLAHALLVASAFGRSGTSNFAFLYARGYGRDCLWAHTMLASITAVLVVWFPAAMLIWTEARSLVQDCLLRSPEFPIMADSEMLLPLKWLLGYAVLLPIFHYVWIRGAQPTRGRYGGVIAAGALAVGLLSLGGWSFPADWLGWLTYAVHGVAILAMLVAGFRLHRRVEAEA